MENNMTYELAKQLKEAGFPQKDERSIFRIEKDNSTMCWCGTCQIEHYTEDDFNETIYCPTLSELIEACGDRFEQLNAVKDELVSWKWEAHTDGYCMIGSTPEEAVARLWLEIHK